MRAEVHKHGVVFHAEYDAEPVLVVRHLIVDGERLGRPGQGAPSASARRIRPLFTRWIVA
jgi:hypothetical protein